MTEGLRRLLANYRTADTTEKGYRHDMLALLEADGDPFHRDNFVPGHFTASAFILSPDEQQLLLIFHGKLERWLQPGGHIERIDADIVAAARREIKEEVGLTDVTPALGGGLVDLDVHAIPPLGGDPEHLHYDVRFAFRASSLAFRAGSDAKAARWFPFDAITLQQSDASVMRAVQRIRASALGPNAPKPNTV